jgi:hypothetical protein
MNFMAKSFSKILIIVAIGVLIVGGIFAWQYYYVPKTAKLFTIPEGQGDPYQIFNSAVYQIFSPDNKRFAYIAGREREKNFVVLDGTEQKIYNYVDPSSLTFSSDNNHFAYIAANNAEWPYKATRPVGGEWRVVYNGTEQKEYQNVHSFVFSADGKQYAYVASKSGSTKEFVVLNGNEQKNYDEVHSPIFSPDNNRFAYVARIEGKEFLVSDGAEQKNIYDKIKYLSFSLDGQQIAYVAHKNSVGLKETMGVELPYDAESVVLNAKEQKQYESIDELKFHFGGKFTYRRFDSERGFFLVVDNKEYANGRDPVFSQNHFAYVVVEDENWSMVLDGTIRPYRGIIGPIVFSADGKHYIYVVQPKGSTKEFAVVDGVAQPERDANIIFPILSSDGKHFAYVSQQNNQKSLVTIDGKELSQYDKVWEPRFTKDGKYLIYNTLIERDLWLIVNNVE